MLFTFELLFLGADYIENGSKLDVSANLKLLYTYYVATSALKITLPIATTFAVIATKIHLITKNELVAIYSLGSTRSRALLPLFSASLTISFVYVLLHGLYFYDSQNKAEEIVGGKPTSGIVKNMFLKYDDNYIFIKKLFSVQKRAKGFEIFVMNGDDMVEKIDAKSGRFVDDEWILKGVTRTIKTELGGLKKKRLRVVKQDQIKTLKGFLPSIMNSVYDTQATPSFRDSFDSFLLLVAQNISTQSIRSLVYANYIVPFFAPLFCVVIFFVVPISVRFFNLAIFSSVAVFLSLCVWGVIFILSQLAITGSTNPELAIIMPLVLSTIFASYLFRKHL